jgi:hypothetical protein
MHSSGRAALFVAFAILFAGCGGRGGSGTAMPPSSGSVLHPQLNGGNPGITLPTLYVSGQGAAYAYDLGASGDTAPVTKTTGYYYQAGGPGGATASIAGIATNTAGDLVIAQNFSNPQGDGDSCALVYIPARSGPNAANTTATNCGPGGASRTSGTAVGITFTGPPTGSSPGAGSFADDVDVLMHYTPSGNPGVTACYGSNVSQYEVDRYKATSGTITPQSCVVLDQGPSASYRAVSGSTNGAFFVDYVTGSSGTIERYDGVNTIPTNTGTTPGAAGPLAVSVNYAANLGYRVVASTSGGITTIYSFKVSGGGFAFSHALGTFNNPIGALAVDNNGSIYVGVNQPNGVTKVKVYGPAKTQATDPDYILNNPVRRPNPAASPAATITGIAITQANSAPPATPTVVYNSIPAGPLSSMFSSLGIQPNHENEFGDGVNLTGTGNVHTVSWILRSFGCESRLSATQCVTTPGATFPVPITTNIYAVDSTASTKVGALLGSRTQTFNIPYRPSSAPGRCTSKPDYFFDTVSGACVNALAVRVDLTFPTGSVALPSPAIFTMTFNTTTFGYSPLGTGTTCWTSSTGGCGYDQLNISASTLGGPVGSAYDPNSVFNSVATGTATYEGGDCSPTPLYPANTLTLDNGCWGATTDFPGGLHPQLQVTIQ